MFPMLALSPHSNLTIINVGVHSVSNIRRMRSKVCATGLGATVVKIRIVSRIKLVANI